MFQTKVVAKNHNIFYIQKHFPDNRAFYVIGNVGKCQTARKILERNIIRRKRNV